MSVQLTMVRSRLAALLASEEEPGLDHAVALLAAAEDPSIDPDDVVVQLDVLAEGLWIPDGASEIEQVARLNQHLFQHWGFSGDKEDYGAPINSRLDQVIARRKGLPILLCVIYMEVARRVGIPMEGVGFPGHFLVAHAEADPRFWVDPFNEGRVLKRDTLVERLVEMAGGERARVGPPDRFLRGVPQRYVLIRICNNLKGAWLRQEQVEGALRSVEHLLMLDPKLVEERRDLGLMLHHLGRTREARAPLLQYLDEHPGAPDREQIEALLTHIG